MRNCLMMLAVLFLCACAPNYSEGSRVGVVTKLSNKGLFVKSWEGEMVIGGMRRHANDDGSSSMVANVFAFNVDPSVVEQVKAAQISGKPVELVYHQWFWKPPTIGHSSVIIAVKEPHE